MGSRVRNNPMHVNVNRSDPTSIDTIHESISFSEQSSHQTGH